MSIEGPSGAGSEARCPWDVECCRVCSLLSPPIADAHGAHALAFDALLGAVPFTAVAALEAFGAYLEDRARSRERRCRRSSGRSRSRCSSLSCAARSPARHTLPPLGASALAACLGVFVLKAVVALAPYARLALRPAKP